MVHKRKKKVAAPIAEKTEGIDDNDDSYSFQRDRRARIIVRNLPFANLSEESVNNIFSKYGNIVEINLLKKPNGKFVGCGFVEYDNRQSAAKAIAHTNQTKMSGRPIIVDWALSKQAFVEKIQQLNTVQNIKKEEDESDDEGKTVEYSIDKKPTKRDPLDSSDDDDDREEANDGDNDNDEDEEFDDEDDESDGEEEFDDEDEKPRRRIESNDVEEGTTVFIKNIPFSANNNDLRNCVKKYGSIVHALICIDRLTEHSKGTAFVKFKEKESADNCIKDSQNIFLQDQPLEVTRAVSKSKLEEEKKLRKTKQKDLRNLYLVREGVVMAGSPAAVTVSPPDMAKRLQIEQWKTQILRNLNMFVSRTRLVVHNLPADYDDAKLRNMMQTYSPPSAVIKEARVMRNTKKVDSQGQPSSKEVAFVTYTTHEDALSALRKINNNPNIFTPNKRPIVSFSIENREILNLKQKRLEKSKAKLGVKPEKGLEKLTRKQRRFLKRKEKIIKMRQEAKKSKVEGDESGKAGGAGVKKVNGVEKKRIEKDSVVKNQKGKKRKMEKLDGVENGELKNPKGKKLKVEKINTPSTNVSVKDEDNFGGVETVPGKKFKMRSQQKLKMQAEMHRQRLKEVKRMKKQKKEFLEKKKMLREKEPGMKKGGKHKKFDDDKLSKLINNYRSKIENAPSYKKWYET